MADNRTMAQMLQAPIEGYEDAIVVPPINANNFELKQTLINLVQSNQFTGKQDPHNHLRFFNKVTSTFRHPEVPNTTIKLLLFPFSLEDALDSAAGGNFLDKMPRDGLAIIESKSKVSYSRSHAIDQFFMITFHQFQQTAAVSNFVQRNPPNLANQMRPPCFNQPNVQNNQGNQSRYQGNNFNSNQNRGGNFNQGQVYQPPTIQTRVYQAPTPQIQGVSKTDFENYVKANDAVLKNVQNQEPVKQRKSVNVKFQDGLNSPRPNSYQPKLPYPERMKVRENDKPSAQHSRFLKMFKQLHLEIGLKDALVEMPKFNKWLSSLLRNKEKIEEIAITTVNAECSAIIMNKVPEKLEDPGKFLIPCALQELDRTSALADSGASINLLPHSIYKQLGLEALTPTRMTLELANRSVTHPMGIAEDVVVRVDGFTFLAHFVVVNFEPDPRVPIILGRPFLRTAKALIDLYQEKLTLRVGKEELVYYADKSKKNEEKKFVHAISIIDFSKDDLFSGSTTIPSDAPFPSSSPMKTSDSTFEKFTDEFTLPNSLPPGNDVSIHKKDIHEETFSNPLFEFDDNFKSTYLERDSIPPGIDLTLPPTLEVSSSNPTSPTLTGEKVYSWKTPMFFSLIRFVWRMMTRISIRKKIICLLATYLHQKPKPLSRPQEVEEIKEKEDKVSSDVPINTIVMPIRTTFDNPIDFNGHFSKPKDLKKDFTVALDSTNSSILPTPLLDSDSPFTAELSASITLNSLRNEDKVFKPGILVYHAIHDKNLVTLEKNLRENISSRTLLFLKKPSIPHPPPKPPDAEKCLEPEAGVKTPFLTPTSSLRAGGLSSGWNFHVL
ncbi:reverse transcriptase domain-containing protein [Tanacetum coccineum]